jgi:hypothetical protein
MSMDYAFMKSSYQCIKNAECEKCDTHTEQIVMSKARAINNKIFYCPSPELKAAAKIGSGAWKKSKAMAAGK